MNRFDRGQVLIVEDNPTGIASLVGILSDRWDLVIAKSLSEARRLLSNEVDLVLLDLYLPDGKGVELLKFVKENGEFENLPTICISASDEIDDIEEAFTIGAVDYVVKPFNKTILRSKVATCIDLKRKSDLLSSQALRDPLTGIGNRRMFEQYLDNEWRRAMRQGHAIGVVLVDLDKFKHLNDTYGHQQGDRCLQLLARTMESAFCRAGDFVVRLGGDEFVAVLPGSSLESTIKGANRFTERLANACLQCPQSDTCPSFTVSAGCASTVPQEGSSSKELIAVADVQLYEAKEIKGTNSVRPAPAEPISHSGFLAFERHR